MDNLNKLPVRIIEIETSIKLIEYLKRKNIIPEEMYNFCISKLLNKIELEEKKINNGNKNNYKILI